MIINFSEIPQACLTFQLVNLSKELLLRIEEEIHGNVYDGVEAEVQNERCSYGLNLLWNPQN